MRSLLRKPRWSRLIALLGTLVGVYGFGCYQLAGSYLRPIRYTVPKPNDLDETNVPTTTGDTPAWITTGFGKGSPEVVFVLAHGYGGARDTWDPLMQQLAEKGYHAVAPAMPGQEASPDPTVGFGVKEAQVLVDTVRWVREQYAGEAPLPAGEVSERSELGGGLP